MKTPNAEFLPTRWSIVLAAADGKSISRRALEELARAYWFPLYAFIRRQGHSAAESEDLTQEFFFQLLERQLLESVDPAKGRFRSFLLACAKHFLSHQRNKVRAQKRGGNQALISLDSAESRYAVEPADALTPERLFERRWALAVLDQVLARLAAQYAQREESALFDALKETLITSATPSHARIAESLGMTPGAIKVAAHRLRRRYRDILREEIAQTVASPEEINDEISYLLKCL